LEITPEQGQDAHHDRTQGGTEKTCPEGWISPPSETGLKQESERDTLKDPMTAVLDAMDVMQTHFFELWQGTWPNAIDWTAAVLGTHLSASLSTLSRNFDVQKEACVKSFGITDIRCCNRDGENLINKYFSQLVSFYFGQSTFSLRQEAYDDMLWVVLGWLESIKFILARASSHRAGLDGEQGDDKDAIVRPWHGTQFIPSLAHRVRIFYELAAEGWDTKLCGGGMIWNPRLRPYKNAITNELFIAASVSMYLYFPGDSNSSPYMEGTESPARPHDPKYLAAALEAYDWLKASNMTNTGGLYVDGFHIRNNGRSNDTHRNTKCDLRNEMVYTYNQGVLLSGLRGLWESTGMTIYLEDGHALIWSVINATGWNDVSSARTKSRSWAGLGRAGVLEEACDASGTCSQDGQTFKGIFFHHLTLFCSPLKPIFTGPEFVLDSKLAQRHMEQCKSYSRWVTHNAKAAYATRNHEGQFGMWWSRRYPNSTVDIDDEDDEVHLPPGAIDYRNSQYARMPREGEPESTSPQEVKQGTVMRGVSDSRSVRDVNDRGRGRTIETQSGGLAVLLAMWEISTDSDISEDFTEER
ncbi:MAG: hypothetical protein M1823_005718, partial [Watsoniomyces obsoletus]